MATEGKRYYWLRLKEDFFSSKRIKKLKSYEKGDTYIIIYLKMQLSCIRKDGVLKYTGVEDDFASEIALDIDENPDDVRFVIEFLLDRGLAESVDDSTLFLPYAVENTGSESTSAQRVRNYREKAKALHCNADETQVKRTCNVEIEIEKEIEKEKDIEDIPRARARAGEKRTKKEEFVPPTLEEVTNYGKERNSCVDPKLFFEFFDAGNWIDSRGSPVRNWKQKFITWERKEVERNGRKSSGNEPVHGEDDGGAGTAEKNYGFHYDV